MNAQFSDPEYRRVLMLTFLGEWMLNAIRKDPDPDFEDTASKIYSFAHGTALEELVSFNSERDQWVASESLEKEAHAFIDQYDDKTFWEELTSRVTERDLLAFHGERVFRGMRAEQQAREISRVAKAYTKEFEDHGIDRLQVSE